MAIVSLFIVMLMPSNVELVNSVLLSCHWTLTVAISNTLGGADPVHTSANDSFLTGIPTAWTETIGEGTTIKREDKNKKIKL